MTKITSSETVTVGASENNEEGRRLTVGNNANLTYTGDSSLETKPDLTINPSWTSGYTSEGKVIIVNGNADLSMSDLGNVSIVPDGGTTNRIDGIVEINHGSTWTVNNVDNMTFGSADKHIQADQAIHAFGGAVDINVNNNYEQYVDGSGALMVQNLNGNDSHLNITAGNDIIAVSDRKSVITVGAYYGKDSTASMKLTAGGNVEISCGNQYASPAIYVNDTWTGTPGKGNADLTISAGKDVSVTGSTALKLNHTATGGTSEVNITAGGDVSLIGTVSAALQSINAGAENQVNISGNNVLLETQGSTNAAVEIGTGDIVSVTGNTIRISGESSGQAITNAGGSMTLGSSEKASDITIDGRISVTDGGSVTFADNTTTHVDAKWLTDENNAFITTDNKEESGDAAGDGSDAGTASLLSGDGADSSKSQVVIKGDVVIENIKTGQTLNFTNDTESITGKDNIYTSNRLQKISLDSESGELVVGTVSEEEAKKNFAGAVMINTAIAATAANHDAITALINGKSEAEAVRNLNEAANLPELGGLSHTAYTVSNLFTDAVDAHYKGAVEDGLWANYIHSEETVDGMGGNGRYDADYDGAVVGMDLYHQDGKTYGAAVTYVNGSVSGSVNNDADYYGISLYGQKESAAYTLRGDLTWLKGSSDMTQRIAGVTSTASPDADAVSLGVKVLKDIEAGSGTLTPYIGARYMRICPESFTASNGIHYDEDSQDLFLVPVGADYSMDIRRGDWTIRPEVGLGYIWTMGNRTPDQTISFEGGADTFGITTADSGSFLAKVGISAEKDAFGFGIHYAHQDGDNTDADTWTVSASYHF